MYTASIEVKFCSYNPSSNFKIYLQKEVLLFQQLLHNHHARLLQLCKVVNTLHKFPQSCDNLAKLQQVCYNLFISIWVCNIYAYYNFCFHIKVHHIKVHLTHVYMYKSLYTYLHNYRSNILLCYTMCTRSHELEININLTQNAATKLAMKLSSKYFKLSSRIRFVELIIS